MVDADRPVALPWSHLSHVEAQGRAAHLRLWQNRFDRCQGNSTGLRLLHRLTDHAFPRFARKSTPRSIRSTLCFESIVSLRQYCFLFLLLFHPKWVLSRPTAPLPSHIPIVYPPYHSFRGFCSQSLRIIPVLISITSLDGALVGGLFGFRFHRVASFHKQQNSCLYVNINQNSEIVTIENCVAKHCLQHSPLSE